MNRLKKIFLGNIKIKLVCLIVAILMWIFVASNQSLLGKFPNQIPIKTANLSEQYQAFLDQDKVQISAMAEPAVWRTLTTDSFVASVDLAGKTEGTYELDVNVVSNVANVQVTKVEPSKVFVNIEKIISKTVTLTPKIEGDPADGLVLGQISLEPESVEVRGPKSYVESISEANALIKLNGESESFERDAKVIAVVENSNELKDLTFNPATVSAKVTIAKGGNNKTVGVRVKTKGTPKDGYYISKITTTPLTLDIVGQRSIVSNINFLDTEEIDITNLTDTVSKDVNLILPDGVSLQKGASQKIKVEITFSSYGTTKSISPTLQPVGLADGLRLLSYSPSDIKVSLSGPQQLLAGIGTNDIQLNLDLTGKAAGTYNIDINISMLKIPDGITASNITPGTISVTIGN